MIPAIERPAMAADRRFFAGMALVLLLVVFAGFASTYYLWPLTRTAHFPSGKPVSRSLPLIVHLHAVAFTGWILLLVTQVSLVAARRTAVHRRLGMIGAWLIPPIVITGLLTLVQGARDGHNPGGPYPDALSFMFVGVADLIVFTGLAAAGILLRRRPDLHKRLMVLATVGIMWPAITRIPLLAPRFMPMFAVLAALALAPAIRDFAIGARTRWVSLAIGAGILATFPMRVAIGNSAWWRALAAWLIQ